MATNLVNINASAATPQAQVQDLNLRFDQAVKLGKQSEREKLLVFAGGFIFITQQGGFDSPEVKTLLVYKGINNKVDAYNKAAQLVLGLVIDSINGTATKALIAGIAAPRQRAMFDKVKLAEDSGKLTLVSRDSRVKDVTVKFRPMAAFGSSKHSRQWTIKVREEFNAAIATKLDMELGVLPADLARFAEKAGAGRHDVAIKLTHGTLSLAHPPRRSLEIAEGFSSSPVRASSRAIPRGSGY